MAVQKQSVSGVMQGPQTKRDRTARALVSVANNQHLIKDKVVYFCFEFHLPNIIFTETGFLKCDFLTNLHLPPLDFSAFVWATKKSCSYQRMSATRMSIFHFSGSPDKPFGGDFQFLNDCKRRTQHLAFFADKWKMIMENLKNGKNPSIDYLKCSCIPRNF